MACPRTEEEWLELPVTKVVIADLVYNLDETFHQALVDDLSKWANYQPVRVCIRKGAQRLHNGKHRVEWRRQRGAVDIHARVCHCGAA